MLESGNLFSALPPEPRREELLETLCERPGLRIERIVSTGQATAEDQWYDQETDEWVMLVKGSARIRIDGEPQDRALGEGDFVLLPAHCRHRVTWTQTEPPTIWLAVHFARE
jgi:cupin 2 domain-containing protein